MAEPQSWGSETTPYINSKGHSFTREWLEKRYPVGDTLRSYGWEHLGFAGYMAQCDAVCSARTGLGVFDLADTTWRDNYDDRIEPSSAVTELLEDQGYDVDSEDL